MFTWSMHDLPTVIANYRYNYKNVFYAKIVHVWLNTTDDTIMTSLKQHNIYLLLYLFIWWHTILNVNVYKLSF